MGLAQGNFDRAARSGLETLNDLTMHATLSAGKIDLSKASRRQLLTMLHDLEAISAAIRLELMNR